MLSQYGQTNATIFGTLPSNMLRQFSAEKILLKHVDCFMYHFLCVYTTRCEAIVFRYDIYTFV